MEGGTELGREKGPHGVFLEAECTAIARALAEAAKKAKRRKLGRDRSFTDAQAAITRMTHDELGLG